MVLDRIIMTQTVKLDVSDVDKWTIIEDLVDLIASTGKVEDREELVSAVIERERQGSTGLTDGIAIPHARSNTVSELVGAVAISKDGIDFESSDEKPCHLIFLIVAPTKESAKYLKALKDVTIIAKDKEKFSRLVSATTPEEVVSILSEETQGVTD